MKQPNRHEILFIIWLALTGAGIGAAAAAALDYFNVPVSSISIAVSATLLAAAGLTGLWRAMALRNASLDAMIQAGNDQRRELEGLQEELKVHRQLERELTAAKQAAESAMMAKGEFLATMSHEIRTPLNGIIPMLDLLSASRLAPDQHEILHTAYTSARQMLRIVDDILDYSKLEANKLQLESTSFNLREMIDSLTTLLLKPAESKGLRLTQHIDPGVRLAVRGDPVRLRQVLTNLLSNALKFTERGAISLHVTRKGETRTQHELRFEVRDSGIGIAKEHRQNLFRAFSQADASTTRLYGGTGLGLVICKRIVDLMGGTIGVESESGRGATFWFEIPLLKAAGDTQGLRAELNGCRALLLSNDLALRQRLQQALPNWGVQLTETDTTQDALTLLRGAVSRGSTWAFDLLLVDLNSVRSTAVALHRNLRRTATLEDLRVVYLQGNEPPLAELSQGQHVLMLSRAIGNTEMRTALTDLLATPAAPVPAEEIIPDAFTDAPPRASAPGPTAVPRLHGQVLLVEDNPVNQMVAKRLVSMLGLGCETADNGESALERMISGQFDVVLMDCQMPVKDGYTAAREWRQYELDNNLTRLPIIAMTANAMAGDRQKCLDAGMDDYLSKPVDRRLLETTLSRWLTRSPVVQMPTTKRDNVLTSIRPSAPVNMVRPEPDVMPPPAPVVTPAIVRPPTALPPATPITFPRLPPTLTAAPPAITPVALPPRPTIAPTLPSVPAARPPSPAVTPPPIFRPAAPTPSLPGAPSRPITRPSTPMPVARPAPTAPATPAATTPPLRSFPNASTTAAPTAPMLPVLALAVVDELRAIMGPDYLNLVRLFLEDAPSHLRALEMAAAASNVAGMIAPAHALKSSSANLGALALSGAAKRIELSATTGELTRPTVAVLMLEAEFRKAQAALQNLLEPKA